MDGIKYRKKLSLKYFMNTTHWEVLTQNRSIVTHIMKTEAIERID